MNRSRLVLVDLILLSVILIWGMNFAVMKLLYSYFHPLAFNALRFTLTAVTMVCVLKARGESLRLDRTDVPAVIALGIVSTTFYQFLFVLGLARTKAGNAALLMALAPIFAYLTGVLLKREGFSRSVLGGILLSVIGVFAVIVFGPAELSFAATWKGDFMIVGAALCWGSYTGSAAPLIARYGTLRLTVWVILTGTTVLVPLSLPWVLRQDWLSIGPAAWLAFCYSTFLSIVYCSVAWTFALRHIGVAHTAVFSNLTPVIALFGAWLLLREVPTIWQLAGVFLILSGVFVVRSHKPSTAALPEE